MSSIYDFASLSYLSIFDTLKMFHLGLIQVYKTMDL